MPFCVSLPRCASRNGVGDLNGKPGTANIARQMVLSGLKHSKIGRHFGCTSYRTVGADCLNYKATSISDKALRKKYIPLKVTCRQECT